MREQAQRLQSGPLTVSRTKRWKKNFARRSLQSNKYGTQIKAIKLGINKLFFYCK